MDYFDYKAWKENNIEKFTQINISIKDNVHPAKVAKEIGETIAFVNEIKSFILFPVTA